MSTGAATGRGINIYDISPSFHVHVFVIDAHIPLQTLTFSQVTATPPPIDRRVLLCLKTDGSPLSWARHGFVIECATGIWTCHKYCLRPCLPLPVHAAHNLVIKNRRVDALHAAQVSVAIPDPPIPLYIPG